MKKRRQFIRRLGGLLTFTALAPAVKAIPDIGKEGTEKLDGNFVHIVFFWLIDENPETDRKFYREVQSYTSEIDEIRSIHIGTPADTDRDVVDNSYSYCMVTTFDSKKEHDIYQEHPAHLRFIENASSLWTKVLVYDSVPR